MKTEEQTKYELDESVAVTFIKTFAEKQPDYNNIKIEQKRYDGDGIIINVNTINIDHKIFKKISDLVDRLKLDRRK